MGQSQSDLVEAIALLAEKRQIRVTVSQCAKGAGFTFATAFLGGLVGGPIGLAVGATIGGVSSAVVLDDFKPLAKVLREDLSDHEREQLKQHIINAVEKNKGVSSHNLARSLFKDDNIRLIVLMAVNSFLKKYKGMSVEHF